MKWLDVLLIAALVVSVVPVSVSDPQALATAQDDAAMETTESAEPAQPGPETSLPADEANDEFGQVEQILEDEEEMIQGAYTYDAGRRRDPFISLLRPRTDPNGGPAPGLDCPIGCLIDEITLTGIFVMPEGPVAQILSPDQEKSYLIRVGDEFHDGDVIAITPEGVRFRQMVNDFQEMKPYREVFKELNP